MRFESSKCVKMRLRSGVRPGPSWELAMAHSVIILNVTVNTADYVG